MTSPGWEHGVHTGNEKPGIGYENSHAPRAHRDETEVKARYNRGRSLI